jgi:hypothetical protein
MIPLKPNTSQVHIAVSSRTSEITAGAILPPRNRQSRLDRGALIRSTTNSAVVPPKSHLLLNWLV